MFTKPEDFAKSGINTALFFANTTFDGIERLALLNLAAARSVFEGAMSNFTALLGAKDVNAFVSLQKEMASPSIEKGMEYSRNVIAIASETKEKLAKEVEKIALEDDYFVSRKLYPNVDFYSGIVQRAIGIPVHLFTGVFALARTVGWIAQLNEMISDPEYKIGRPRQLFTGSPRRDI